MGDILWAEDSPQDQALIRYALEECSAPWRVAFVDDGGALLERLSSELPDLVVLDLKMPRVSGLEALGRLRAEPATRQLPVVVFTSSDRPSEMEQCQRLGIAAYLQKPVDYGAFVEAVRAIISHVPAARAGAR